MTPKNLGCIGMFWDSSQVTPKKFQKTPKYPKIFGMTPKIWGEVHRFLEKQSILTTTTILDGLQKVLSEKQTTPFGFLLATQDDRKWEFFMSDFEWTASAESGPDNVENL